MLIKSMDNREDELASLQRAAATLTGTAGRRAADDLRRRQAGIKGEREAAYQIDFYFKPSKNSAVIHDLRIESGGRVAQIDHLILTRSMECYVLESKAFHAGIKITEEGEFLRWDDFRRTYVGMESPLLQNERHIAVLKDAMQKLNLPTRLGVRIMPTFRSFVLVSSASRIDRPKKFDASRVIKADQIKKRFLDDIDHESTLTTLVSAAKMVSRETVRRVALQLAALHRPMKWPVPGLVPAPAAPVSVTPAPGRLAAVPPPGMAAADRIADRPARARPACGRVAEPPGSETARRTAGAHGTVPPTESGPRCKKCGGVRGMILHGKYGYYFKCADCAGNTSIRFECQPGHAPRLRKAGNTFYRDCPECGSSREYFVNAADENRQLDREPQSGARQRHG